MRITSNMMSNNFLNNLNNNLGSVADYQRQLSSGKVINSLSDDPVRLISSMQCRVRLNNVAQYKSSVESAQTWLSQTETSVSELNEVIKSAYETAVRMSNDDMTADDKDAAAALIKQLRDQVVTIANSQSSDKYVFGGYNVNRAPITVDGTGNIYYNGLDLTDDSNPALIAMSGQSIAYPIGFNATMDISVSGTDLLGTGDDNIYSVLNGFYNALSSDADAADLSNYITKIQDNQDRVLTTQSKIGGMTNRLDLLVNRYEEERLSYSENQSKIEDVDVAETYVKYSTAQTVYNAALQVGTQIIQQSILDYLR